MQYRAMFRIPAAPRFTLLFSAHMADAPGRKMPRFPLPMEGEVHMAIAQRNEAIGIASGDLKHIRSGVRRRLDRRRGCVVQHVVQRCGTAGLPGF